ncbi:hypothetical protein GN956_G7475 [Arapaima gigas]
MAIQLLFFSFSLSPSLPPSLVLHYPEWYSSSRLKPLQRANHVSLLKQIPNQFFHKGLRPSVSVTRRCSDA